MIPADCLSDVSAAALYLEMDEAIQACMNFDLTDKESGQQGQNAPQQHEQNENGQNTSAKLPLLDSTFGGLLNQNEANDGSGAGGVEVTQASNGSVEHPNSYGSYPDQDALSEISVQNEEDMMYPAGSSEQGSQRNGNQSSSQYPYHHYVPPIEQTFSPRPMPKMLSTHMTILPGMLPSQAFFQDQPGQGQFPVDAYYLTPQGGQFYPGNFVQDQPRSLPEYNGDQNLGSQSYGPQTYQSTNEGHQRVDSGAVSYQQQNANYTGLDYGDNVALYNDSNDIALVSSERELQSQNLSQNTRKDTLQQPSVQEKSIKTGFKDKTKASHSDNVSSLKPMNEGSKYFINISPTVQETNTNPFIEAISPYNPDVEIGGPDPVPDLSGSMQNSALGNSRTVVQGMTTSQSSASTSVSMDTGTSVPTAHINMISTGDINKTSTSSSANATKTSTAKSKEQPMSGSSFSSRPAARMPPKKAGYRGIASDYNKHPAVFSMQHNQNYDASAQSKQSEDTANSYTDDVMGQNNYKQNESSGSVSCNTVIGTKSHQPKLTTDCSNLDQGNPVTGNHDTTVNSQQRNASDMGPPSNIQELLQSKPYLHMQTNLGHSSLSSSKVITNITTKDVSHHKSRGLPFGAVNKSQPSQPDKTGLSSGVGSHFASASIPPKAGSLLDTATHNDLSGRPESLSLPSHPNMMQNTKPTTSLPPPEVVHIQTKKMAASHAAKVANGMASQQLSQSTQSHQLSQDSQSQSLSTNSPVSNSHSQRVSANAQSQSVNMPGGVGLELSSEYRSGHSISFANQMNCDNPDTRHTAESGKSEMSTVDTAPIDAHSPAKRPTLPALDQHHIYNAEVVENPDVAGKSATGGNLTPNKNCNVVDLVDSYIEDYLRSIDQGSDNQSPVKSGQYSHQQQVNQTMTHPSGAGTSYASTSFTNNTGSTYNYPNNSGTGTMQGSTLPSNSITYSVEEVSKTILNVLNQECFDDDSGEGNLPAKGQADQGKKQQESVPLTTLLKMVPFHKTGGHQINTVTEGNGHLTQYAEITSSQGNVDHLMQGNSSEDDDIVPRFEDIESASDDDSNYNLVIDFDKEIHEESETFEESGKEVAATSQKGAVQTSNKKVPKTPTKTSSPTKANTLGKEEGPITDAEDVNKSLTPRKRALRPTKKVSRRFLSPMKIPRYRLTTDYREDPEARPGHKSLHRSADEIVKPPKKRIKLKLLMTKLQDDNMTVTRKMLQKKEHKRKIKYICELCQREFWDRYKSFADHMQDHMQNELTFCNICGKGYKRMEDLSRHRAENHDLYSFQCVHCDQNFTNSLSYKKHSVTVHQEKKPFYCVYDSCGYRSEKFNELEKHLLVHSVDKQFACPHCSKRFSQPNGLRSHLTTCMNMQSYVCPVCSKTFNRQQGLRDHMVLHKGTKSHVCNQCGASFNDPRNLGRHARTHSSEKKYACKHCDLKFKFSNCLKRHITRKHPDKETVTVGKKGGRNKKEVLVTNYSAKEVIQEVTKVETEN